MKKFLLAVAVVAVSSLLLDGCARTSRVAAPELKKEFAKAPEWVLDPSAGGRLSAVGSTKIGKADLSFYKARAMATARDELARILNLKVRNVVKNFTETTEIGNEQTIDMVSEQVSKQVADVTLSGSKLKDIWISPSREIFVLVVLDQAMVADIVKESVETSLRNRTDLWKQFQAKKANEELEAEVEKEFGEF